jgi:monoamine oxidase
MARIAVIGAGAAGISAGRALAGTGHEVVLWEARDRVGGRAHTDTTFAAHPIELGAEFIHGERVATWDWVRAFDAPTTGAAHTYEMWFHLYGRLLDRESAHADFGADPLTAVERLTRKWLDAGRPEATLDQVLDLWPEIADVPLTAERRRLIENHMSELAASDLRDLSTDRILRPLPSPPETLRHFRLLNGYRALMTRAADGLHLRLGTPVTRIRWDDTSAEVHAGDAVERFDRVIVTLPLGVLRRSAVEFDPPLPDTKQRAIDGLNLGHISKVLLKLDQVYWPPDLTFLWTPLSTQLWWRPGQGQLKEEPVLTAYFGGADAARLDEASEAEAVEEASRQLGDILGRSLTRRVVAGRFIAWRREPYTSMGYTSLPMGGRGMREALAEPAGALAFAGEATSLATPATVHGAIESGRRAAGEVLASLGSGR